MMITNINEKSTWRPQARQLIIPHMGLTPKKKQKQKSGITKMESSVSCPINIRINIS